MGYVLQAQCRLKDYALLNMAQMKQRQLFDLQTNIANQNDSVNQQLNSLTTSQSSELAQLYRELSTADSAQRDSVNAKIKEAELKFEQDKDELNQKIYELSIRENIMEREVKRMDTIVSVLQKQVDAMTEAEGKGITNATPKYNGLQG